MNPPRSRYLVVEDGEEDAFILRQLLERSGITNILVCHTAEAAVEKLDSMLRNDEAKSVPQVAFVDVGLPGSMGFEFLRAVRESEKLRDMIVILLSASEAPRNLGKAMQLGADCFLIKFPSISAMRTIVTAIDSTVASGEGRQVLPITGNLLLSASGAAR